MKPVSVLVVIVNYRTPTMALDAAGALEIDVRIRGNAHVVIVDNGSDDGSEAIIAEGIEERGYGDWCTLIADKRNGGFAAGNNLGIAWCRHETGQLPEFAWLLNPDTIAESGALDALANFLKDHLEVGIAGSRCIEPDGTAGPSRFRFPTLRTELNAAVNFGPLTRLLLNPAVSLPVPEEPVRSDWVSGASLMIRRIVLETVGPMDEGYFLYFEETDYCARAAKAGFQIWTVPSSRVTHIGGVATGLAGKAPTRKRRPRYWFASRARFLIHHHGVAWTHVANALWLVGYPIGRLIAAVRGKPNGDPPHFWRDFLVSYYGAGGIMYSPAERARGMGNSASAG